MFSTDRPSWRNPRVLTILALIFVCGALCGAVTMRWLHRGGPEFWKGETPVFSYERLNTELKLRPDQQQRLKQILDDYSKYHHDLQEQLNDWQATGKNQIMGILDPQQKTRFISLTEAK